MHTTTDPESFTDWHGHVYTPRERALHLMAIRDIRPFDRMERRDWEALEHFNLSTNTYESPSD